MLYIIATPIGNLEDISLRSLRVLKEADIILAEDTRKTGLLLKYYNICRGEPCARPLISFHDHNEEKKIPQIISLLRSGKKIALVSSAGTPTISDPGYKLVRECRKQGLSVTAVPGACSIINGLSLSSAAHDKFAFLGYLPRKKNERRRLLESIKDWDCSVVFFESPFRIKKSLDDISAVFPHRQLSVIREMTKKFEEAVEGEALELTGRFSQRQLKGEIVVILEKEKGDRLLF